MTDFESKKCNSCGRVYSSESEFLEGTSRWRKCDAGHLWFNCDCGSTLIVKKGKFAWYSPDQALSTEAAGVFHKLGDLKELPSIPNAVMQLQLMISDPDYEPEKLAQAARNDPFISASIYQIAENIRKARNPTTAKISSLQHAIVYVGKDSIANIITTAALRSFNLPPSGFDENKYWQENYLRGAISETIVQKIAPDIERDQAYVAGMLANVGKLVTAICFPALVTKISKDTQDVKTLSNWRKAEQDYKFPEHTILGEIAATLWGLPEFVMDVCRHHHTAPKNDRSDLEQDPKLEWVVGLANQLTHWVMSEPHLIEMDLLNALGKTFNLSEQDIEKEATNLLPLRDTVDSKIDEMKK